MIGAGHVARCLPLAVAFADLGWSVSFVGDYGGFAAWLLDRAGERIELPAAGAPCGLADDDWDAAIIDSYVLAPSEICTLAGRLPVVTLGEAKRCETAGVMIDYHLDRSGERSSPRVLRGPTYAPLDPAFSGRGRAGDDIRTVLITVGGSEPALKLVPELTRVVRRDFPDAELLVPRGPDASPESRTVREPVRLLDIVDEVDVAVSAAGLTAYELACAGIPQVAVAIVSNQRRVVDGLRRSGLAPCVDLCAGENLAEVANALGRLSDSCVRKALSEGGRRTFDGRGAARAAEALLERWAAASTDAATIHDSRGRG